MQGAHQAALEIGQPDAVPGQVGEGLQRCWHGRVQQGKVLAERAQ
jgi:hypothetical protein